MSRIKAIIDHFYTCTKEIFYFLIKRSIKGLFSYIPITTYTYEVTLRRCKAVRGNFFGTFLVIFIIISLAIFLPKAESQDAQLSIIQNDFSGGAAPNSKGSLTNWNQYDYADSGIAVTPQGDLTLQVLPAEFKDAVSDEFKQGQLDSGLVVSEDKILLSRPTGVREYTVGALSPISVTISAIYGYGPFDISLSGDPDLSRLFKNDQLTDAAGHAYKILSVSDSKNRMMVIDSEDNHTAPVTGDATVGRWFASLSSWETAREGDLTGTGKNTIERAICYYDGSQDMSNLVIDGWVTDQDHYVEITVPASERHKGVWMANAYTLVASSGQANIIVRENYTKINGLQIESTATDAHYNVILEASEVELAGNILKGAESQVLQNWTVGVMVKGNSSARIYNNILYGFTTASMRGRGIAGGGGAPNVILYNNTIYGCDIGVDVAAGGVWLARNTISYNNANNYHGTFDFASSHNLSGPIEKSAPGSEAKNGVFVDFMDETGRDFHLNILDSGAKDAGVDLTADTRFSMEHDIDGQTREGTWDMGADDAGAGATIVHSIGTKGRDFTTLQAWETARQGDLTRRNVFKITDQSGAFEEGETIINGEGASGRYVKERDVPSNKEPYMTLDDITGTFATDNVLFGQSSGASARLQMAVAVDGVIEKGEVFHDTAFTSGVEIKGSTIDADHYMILSAAPRNCHVGAAGTGAKIDLKKAKESAVVIADDYAVVEWLEITNWGGGEAGIKVKDAEGAIVRHNMIHDNDSASTKNADNPAAVALTGHVSNPTIAHNIIYNIANSRESEGTGISAAAASNVKVMNNIVYKAAGTGIDGGSAMVKNNISVGNGTDFSGGTQIGSGSNVSSDTTAPGSGSLTGKSVEDLDFVSIAAGVEDLHTQAGSVAQALKLYLPVEYSGSAANSVLAAVSQNGYTRRGVFVSRIYDTSTNPVYKTVTSTATIAEGTSVEFKLRSGMDSLMSGASDWEGCPAMEPNTETNLSGLACLTDGARYIQYRAELISDDGKNTPEVDEVVVAFEGYPQEPVAVISSAFNTGSPTAKIGTLQLQATTTRGVNEVRLQMRTAADKKGAPARWGEWLGPTGRSDYYEGTPQTTDINPTHQDGKKDQWIQYKVQMATASLSAPVFSGIQIAFGEDLDGMALPGEEVAEVVEEEEVPVIEEVVEEPVLAIEKMTEDEVSDVKAAGMTNEDISVIDDSLETQAPFGTQLYDVVIKIGDNNNPDPMEDMRASFKEGDVVVALPVSQGHVWSDNERRSFLIIQLYLTPEEAKQLTEPKIGYSGEVDDNGNLIKEVQGRRERKVDLKTWGIDNGRAESRKVKALKKVLDKKAVKKETMVKVKP